MTNAWGHAELLGCVEDEEQQLAERARAHAEATRRASLVSGREPPQPHAHAGFSLLIDAGLCGFSRRLRFSAPGAQRAALLLALRTAAAARPGRGTAAPPPSALPAAPSAAAAPPAAVGQGDARGDARPPDEVGEQGEVEVGLRARVRVRVGFLTLTLTLTLTPNPNPTLASWTPCA